MKPDYSEPERFAAAQQALAGLIERVPKASELAPKARTPIAGHVLSCLRRDNLQALYFYQDPRGRHHADLLLRRTAPGLPRLIRLAGDGLASREAAEQAALQLVGAALARTQPGT
ncbi:hypothetical protein CKO28_04820 [Rhodovibrio sodomensis]|uniref:Uncharacterized protein n=1 Tax=Rhodovibrio sodomensis TaxID=1088 RepID=A0ABS1DA90_9PROT|nr:hypothetical protein [Rhodovibrio sodomensis]MBK1667351.1 hypothetical protein [Rhodovibrio sodomensis]